MNDIVKLVRGLTRPLLALILVIAVIALALTNREPGESLKTLTAMAVAFWFAQHREAKDG